MFDLFKFFRKYLRLRIQLVLYSEVLIIYVFISPGAVFNSALLAAVSLISKNDTKSICQYSMSERNMVLTNYSVLAKWLKNFEVIMSAGGSMAMSKPMIRSFSQEMKKQIRIPSLEIK